MNTLVKTHGTVSITLRDVRSNTSVTHTSHNIVTALGLAEVVKAFHGDAFDFPTHIALGEGDTAATAADTDLEDEIVGFRQTVTTSIETSTFAGDTIQFSAVFGVDDANGTLTEVGLFDDVTAGTLFARSVFSPIVKTDSLEATITWRIRIG